MSIERLYHRLSCETIRDYLDIANYSISTHKDCSNQCYGMPALLLLSSAIDAIGSYYSYSPKKGVSLIKKDVNKVVKSPGNATDHYTSFFHLESVVEQIGVLPDDEISLLYELYRCKATHNATLGENNCIGRFGDTTRIITKFKDVSIVNLDIIVTIVEKAYYQLAFALNPKAAKEYCHPSFVPATAFTQDIKFVMQHLETMKLP